MLYNALLMGKKPRKIVPSPWDFVTLQGEDRAMAIGNMHKKLVKIVRVVREICSRTDRQTDTQTCMFITTFRHHSRNKRWVRLPHHRHSWLWHWLHTKPRSFQITTRWLYCVECPQYSIRLEVLSYLYTSCSRRGLVSRDSTVDGDWLPASEWCQHYLPCCQASDVAENLRFLVQSV